MLWGLIACVVLIIVGLMIIFEINICCCRFKNKQKYKDQDTELISKLSSHSSKRRKSKSKSSESKSSKSKSSESKSSKSKSKKKKSKKKKSGSSS